MSASDYLSKNLESWNRRTAYHLASDFYDNKKFIEGKSSLKSIELDLLGDVRNKKILHLQCHFGQDTLSLARLGAEVTGMDLSDKAIDTARALSGQTGVPATFICCDLYSLPQHLNEQFDMVFTSYGVIGWLPDLNRWAEIIAHFLKPGGRFIMAEFHPFVWTFDDRFEKIGYDYFNTGPIVEEESGTYADRNAPIKSEYVGWNHPTSEVLNSLIRNGMALEVFDEFDYSPFNCFQNTREDAPGVFRIAHIEKKIPMVFSIGARKK